LAFLFVAGCKVDQQKEVAEYRKVVDLQPPKDAPLTLRQALLLANQQNERLSIEGENYLQALIQRQRATAAFLPTVNLAPSYFFRDGSSSSDSGSSDKTHGLDVPVSGQINLFNGFRDQALLKYANLTIEQRRALLLDAQEALLADVVRTFYAVLRNEEQIRVLEDSLKVQEERVRDIRGKREAGTARPLDVAQTEAQASATRVTLIDARNANRQSRSALAFLTGSAVQNTPLVDEYVLPETLLPFDTLRERALAERQDLAGGRQAALATRQLVEAAWRQYYPSVTLNLDVYLSRDTSPTDRDWEGLISLNLPLFAAGRINADVRAAWSQFRQAALFESNLTRQVVRDVETAHQSLAASEQRLAELQTQVTAAQQAFDQADASYGVGLATNLERVVAQNALLNAQLQLASEEFQRKIAYLDLLRAVGLLREEAEGRSSRLPTTRATTQPADVPKMEQ
jgi:outer membrane protein